MGMKVSSCGTADIRERIIGNLKDDQKVPFSWISECSIANTFEKYSVKVSNIYAVSVFVHSLPDIFHREEVYTKTDL